MRKSENCRLLGYFYLAKLKRTKTNDAVLRLGVISSTRTETLSKVRSVIAKAGLLDFFGLLFSSVEGIDKGQQQFFELPSQRVSGALRLR